MSLAKAAAVLLTIAAGLNTAVFAATEPTTAASPFSVTSSTAATVTSYSPLIGDNGNALTPGKTATIYNLFGATNSSNNVEQGTGDILFNDNNSQPNTVDFTTPSNVFISGIALYAQSDDGTLNGPRSVGTFTFTADGTQLVDAAPVYENSGSTQVPSVYMFAHPVLADDFIATFSSNPLNTAYGPGPRIYELDAIPAPEPSSIVAFCGMGAMGLLFFAARRRILLRKN